jgi:hypothetical protein
MEGIIAALVLGSLYTLANYDNKEEKKKETFQNSNLPNLNRREKNFPVTDESDVQKDLNYYPDPNAGVDKMFNKLRILNKTGDIVQAVTSQAVKEEKSDPNKSFLSLTGEKINEDGFKHNNMQPFFGSSVKQRVGDYESAEAILDNMQGTGSQQISKESRAPLFEPQSRMNWVNGMPNSNDFIQSRMNPSMKISGVKPWESIQVAPGLNNKEGVYGSGGFNSGMEAREKWMPKTVDELRIATNPKTTYEGVMLGPHANQSEHGLGIQPPVEKNRPDRFYINHGGERLFTTGAASGEANTARSTQPDPHIKSEGTTREYFGGSVGTNAQTVRGKYESSTRPCPSELSKYPGPIKGRTGMNDLGKSGFQNLPNARTFTTENKREYGNASTFVKAIIAPIVDILRPSRKENTIGNIRPTGNMSSLVPKNSLFNPNDKLATTMKETMVHNEHLANINSNQQNNGYLSEIRNESHSVVNQQRDLTNCARLGGIGNTVGLKYAQVYNAAYNARLNPNKEILVQGRAPAGNMKLGNDYMNIKIDKLDSDRRSHRQFVSNNSRITAIPTPQLIGKVNSKITIGSGQQCERNSTDILSAFNCNPYTKPLNSVA